MFFSCRGFAGLIIFSNTLFLFYFYFLGGGVFIVAVSSLVVRSFISCVWHSALVFLFMLGVIRAF